MGLGRILKSRVEKWSDSLKGELLRISVILADGSKLVYGISKETRGEQLLMQLANDLGLQYFRDYRLYLLTEMKHQRLIDNDELVLKALEENTREKGSFQRMFSKLEKLIASTKEE